MYCLLHFNLKTDICTAQKKNQLKLKTEKREEEGQEVAGDISSNNFNQLILIAIPSAITATTAAAAVNRYYG